MIHSQRARFIFFAVASYILLSFAWIYLSDQVLALLTDKNAIVWLSTIKGAFYVLSSAALFFLALRSVPPPESNQTALESSVAIHIASKKYPTWAVYSFALLITAAMFVFRMQLAIDFTTHPMLTLFMLPIILSALIGGLGPGILTTTITLLGIVYFTNTSSHQNNAYFELQLFFLLCNGIAVTLLSSVLRHTVAKLEVEHLLLDSIVSGTSDAVFVKDLHGRYIYVNQAAAQLLGLPLNAVIGADDFTLFDTETAVAVTEQDQIVIESQQVKTIEEQITFLHGKLSHFLVTKGPIFDRKGKITGVFGISREITGLKQSQNAVKESVKALHIAQRLVKLGNWTWDIQSNTHFWSNEIYQIYGREPELGPALYPEVKQYFAPDSWQRLAEAVELCRQEGRPYECEAQVMRPDGGIRWIIARGESEQDEMGRIIRLSGTVQDFTERKKLNEQLQASKERLQLVIEATSDGFWDWDLNTGHVFRSPKYYEVTGYPEAEDTHDLDFFKRLIHPADLPFALDNIEQHLRGASPNIEFDFRLITRSGQQKWMMAKGRTVSKTDNLPTRVVGTLSDISIQKQAELALQEREKQLERVINGSDQGYWNWNIQTDQFEVSARWETMLGYAAGEMNVNTSNWPNIVHPDDIGHALISIERHLQGQAPLHEVEFRAKAKNNTWRWILTRGRIVEWDSNGKPLIMAGTHTDITERKMLELAQNEAAAVFASSYEGIMVVSPSIQITKINTAFTRITGYSEAEVLGQSPKILSSGRQGPEFYREIWQSIAQNDFWRGEIWNQRKNGEIYPELLSISVVRDTAGEIQHYIGIFSDISLIKAHEAELDHAAHYDALTGIPNRLLLADRLHQSILRSARSGQSCAICFLDLDGFKAINDDYGHSVGDQLLIAVTERLKAVLRAEDTLARLGGDEFVLLLSELDPIDECTIILDRVLDAIHSEIKLGDLTLQVTASIGVSMYPADNADPDTLLRHADQAMYLAKEAGKNRYQLFDPESDRKAQTHRKMLLLMQYALANQEFVLFYQPKVDLLDGTIIGLEALIRWQHPERGIVAPAEFLPYLHNSELESTFGLWVIQTALAQAAAWAQSAAHINISLNISANHLLQTSFYPELQAALSQCPEVTAGHIELEILESAAIDDMECAINTLNQCRQLGVKLSLDDFGTGYSSLTYLRKLPIDTLKIDQSFVRDMLVDADDLRMVESVIQLANVFNRKVIAEGVETLEHGSALRRLGCRYAQGYGISKPMPAQEALSWCRRWQEEKVWLKL